MPNNNSNYYIETMLDHISSQLDELIAKMDAIASLRDVVTTKTYPDNNIDVKGKTFADRLHSVMKARGIRAVDLAKATKLSSSAISRYLSGEMQPKASNLALISTALNIDSRRLLFDFDNYDTLDTSKMTYLPSIQYIVNTRINVLSAPNAFATADECYDQFKVWRDEMHFHILKGWIDTYVNGRSINTIMVNIDSIL